ncbi:glycosyltransferase family 4 protein [Chitinophaga sp. NPDC101104]|uniref:glycosyltransferase family 4 protein n=1 Tax=Chitinophaga sp. NPDC101104 TaxID=3390561 RepID=UPI003D0511A4
MRIGFDAKRAFQNRTGLGNYSRTLVSSLAEYHPDHEYVLFAPKVKPLYRPPGAVTTVVPRQFLHRLLKPVWRSRWVSGELKSHGIDVFHGLSAELPFGIHRTGVRSTVTMHDLIFERYPRQYNPIDVNTYRKKAKYACQAADQVIAISLQTKADLIEFYGVQEEKIPVCYQACDPSFQVPPDPQKVREMLVRYNLPSEYFLYVGSVIERKNLARIAAAMFLLKDRLNVPLVVLGDGGAYKKKVEAYLAEKGLTSRVIFLNDVTKFAFRDLPALYQGALALLYPSTFEGFGIPILEALWSHTPVVTSSGSCFAETGGNAALYVDPFSVDSIADGMLRVAVEPALRQGMVEKGILHARHFTPEKCADAVMNVYQNILK